MIDKPKKPKKGFIDNELFSDDNMDISDDTLKNNIDTIANLQEEDIELNEIMDDSFKGKKDDTKADKDDKLNLFNRSDVKREKRDVSNTEKCDVQGEDPDAWRIDNTPGVFDPRWRIKLRSYPNYNISTGVYKKTLEEMRSSGNVKDKGLLNVLSDVTSSRSGHVSEKDDEQGDSNHECESCGYISQDYSDTNGNEGHSGEGSNHECESCGYISRDYSDTNGDGTATSEYESAKEKVEEESLTSPYDMSSSFDKKKDSDTGDKPDDETVPDNKENDGGGKMDVRDQKECDDEPLQKRDVIDGDQKERDVITQDLEKPEAPQKRDVIGGDEKERDVITQDLEKPEAPQKRDVIGGDEKERDVITQDLEELEAPQKRDVIGGDQKECDVITQDLEKPEAPQKHDVIGEECDVTADESNVAKHHPILITPQTQQTGNEQVTPLDLQLDSIVDLSGQMLIDPQTGQAYNIDDVDLSQFNEVFLVNPTVDNPLQKFETVKIQLIEETVTVKEEQEKIDETVVEQIEVNVNTQVEKGDIHKDQDGKVNEDTTQQNKTKETDENSVSKEDNFNSTVPERDVMGGNVNSTVPERHVMTEEKDDTNPDNNKKKETVETSDVINKKQGESDKEGGNGKFSRISRCYDAKRDVTEENPDDVRPDTENDDTEESERDNNSSESDVVVLAQYKEKKKNIEVISLMTTSSSDESKEEKRDVSDEGTKEQKGDVIDEGAQEEKRDVSDEGGKEQKRDVIDEGAKRELKRQKGPMKIAVKSFYK